MKRLYSRSREGTQGDKQERPANRTRLEEGDIQWQAKNTCMQISNVFLDTPPRAFVKGDCPLILVSVYDTIQEEIIIYQTIGSFAAFTNQPFVNLNSFPWSALCERVGANYDMTHNPCAENSPCLWLAIPPTGQQRIRLWSWSHFATLSNFVDRFGSFPRYTDGSSGKVKIRFFRHAMRTGVDFSGGISDTVVGDNELDNADLDCKEEDGGHDDKGGENAGRENNVENKGVVKEEDHVENKESDKESDEENVEDEEESDDENEENDGKDDNIDNILEFIEDEYGPPRHGMDTDRPGNSRAATLVYKSEM